MFEVLVALRRECSGNWTIRLVRLVLRSKKQHKFHHLYVLYSKQQFHWLVNGLEFVGPLAWVQKLGAQKSIPANLFPFLNRGNYSRGGKNGVLVTSWAQARLRFCSPAAQVEAATAQVQRQKWKLLMSRFRRRIPCNRAGCRSLYDSWSWRSPPCPSGISFARKPTKPKYS
jgi:hypothetical protein